MVSKLEGYLLIPHELLHVVGYRLVGKQCRYRLGEPSVMPLGSLTRRERLVGILFPFAVFVTLFGLFALLSGLSPLIVKNQPEKALGWGLALGAMSLIAGGYACTAIGDLRQAYLLIYNKPKGSKTPFDFLAWPTEPQPAWTPLFAALLALLVTLVLILYTLHLS